MDEEDYDDLDRRQSPWVRMVALVLVIGLLLLIAPLFFSLVIDLLND